MNTHPEQWAAMLQRPGSSWGFGALLKDTSVVVLKEDTPPTNNPCRTWDSNPQPSAYKSDLLSIRPRLPPLLSLLIYLKPVLMNLINIEPSAHKWCAQHWKHKIHWSLAGLSNNVTSFWAALTCSLPVRQNKVFAFSLLECPTLG